jgi:hypothetical protein
VGEVLGERAVVRRGIVRCERREQHVRHARPRLYLSAVIAKLLSVAELVAHERFIIGAKSRSSVSEHARARATFVASNNYRI